MQHQAVGGGVWVNRPSIQKDRVLGREGLGAKPSNKLVAVSHHRDLGGATRDGRFEARRRQSRGPRAAERTPMLESPMRKGVGRAGFIRAARMLAVRGRMGVADVSVDRENLRIPEELLRFRNSHERFGHVLVEKTDECTGDNALRVGFFRRFVELASSRLDGVLFALEPRLKHLLRPGAQLRRTSFIGERG